LWSCQRGGAARWLAAPGGAGGSQCVDV
jgi:hypothetical protein